jgi:tRNA modification GTPase
VFATSDAEARAARALLYGGLEERVAAARAALVDVRTLVEASLDFDVLDTGHVPTAEIEALLDAALDALELARGFEAGRSPGGGLPRVVLCGAPNAGKSALFNVLAGADALVSGHAGTTRDLLEGEVVLGGVRATLVDSAGIAAAELGPERTAQVLAERARADADVLLWVVDGVRARRERVAEERAGLPDRPAILVWHKADLAGGAPEWAGEIEVCERVAVSSLRRTGLEELGQVLGRVLAGLGSGRGREIYVRHERALAAALEEARRGREALRGEVALELVAEHLRRATDALDQVSGSTTAEDVLDRIFAAFCLGK